MNQEERPFKKELDIDIQGKLLNVWHTMRKPELLLRIFREIVF
jgi:hypothetical protein